MWQYQNTDELYHHGILGQRWGIRRYQNADGTLTPAGRRKANKLAKKYAKITGKKLIVKKRTVQGNEKPKPKTISEMSDYELQQKINRIYLEQNYAKAIASQQPKPKISKGRKFINTIKKEVIAPAMITAGKKVLTGVLIKQGNKMVKSLSTNNETTKKANQQIKKSIKDYNTAVGYGNDKIKTKNNIERGKKTTKKIIKRQIGFGTNWE